MYIFAYAIFLGQIFQKQNIPFMRRFEGWCWEFVSFFFFGFSTHFVNVLYPFWLHKQMCKIYTFRSRLKQLDTGSNLAIHSDHISFIMASFQFHRQHSITELNIFSIAPCTIHRFNVADVKKRISNVFNFHFKRQIHSIYTD